MLNYVNEEYDIQWYDEEEQTYKSCTLLVDITYFPETRERFDCAGEPESYCHDTSYIGDEPPDYLIQEYVDFTIQRM